MERRHSRRDCFFFFFPKASKTFCYLSKYHFSHSLSLFFFFLLFFGPSFFFFLRFEVCIGIRGLCFKSFLLPAQVRREGLCSHNSCLKVAWLMSVMSVSALGVCYSMGRVLFPPFFCLLASSHLPEHGQCIPSCVKPSAAPLGIL